MEKKPNKNKALKAETLTQAVQLDKNAIYRFVSNGKAASMPQGFEYDVTGEMAQLFLDKKLGEIK